MVTVKEQQDSKHKIKFIVLGDCYIRNSSYDKVFIHKGVKSAQDAE